MNIYDLIRHDIRQDYYQNNYSNDGQRFIAWYLRNIYGLEPFDAKDCITDGSGDKQIDAVYINDDEQRVYIIQGKFTQKAKIDSTPLLEIYSAWTQIKDLQSLQQNANDKLAGKVSEISSALDDEYELCFELVTTSELTKAAQKDSERCRQEMSDYESLSTNLTVIDGRALERKYNDALNAGGASINHDFPIEPGRFMEVAMNGKKAVIAVISLRDCLNIPGIQDGSLFRKNVRQSLGKGVKVNKEIAQSIKKSPQEFFFLHNGITAICSVLKAEGNTLHTEGLSVVNGCQSLTTIYGNSEMVKKSAEGYIIFRFYETFDNERADNISTSTNSQNAVKARDLRSNDKYILALKKAYEQCCTDGLLITKRGEKPGDGKNKSHVIDLSTLGKMLITWHMQKPTDTHVESSIFTSHFNTLFHRTYYPGNVQALNEIYTAIIEKWKPANANPLGLNEALIKQKAYAPYWHLFAVSIILCEINNTRPDMVPIPEAVLRTIKAGGVLDDLVELAGYCTNDAFRDSMYEAQGGGKVFSPHNWPKSGRSIIALRSAVGKRLSPYNPEDKKHTASLKEKLKMSKKDFEPVWRAE